MPYCGKGKVQTVQAHVMKA